MCHLNHICDIILPVYLIIFIFPSSLIIIFIRCELEARADYIALYIHVTETGKGEFTPCVYVYFCLIRYAVLLLMLLK